MQHTQHQPQQHHKQQALLVKDADIDKAICWATMDRPAVVLRTARLRAGLTQAELARRAGTSQPVVSAYERGRRDPTSATLRRLLAAAGERLELGSSPLPVSDIPPPTDPAEHGRRLVEVLSLADAIPSGPRSATIVAPRLVSQ